MEKMKSDYDHNKDHMRMAMLKHEETFREQVYELHRLYRMQKVLMQNVGLGQQHSQQQQQQQQKQERFLVDNNSNKGLFTIDYNHQLSEAAQRSSTLTNINAGKSHQSNISSIMGLQGPVINDHHRVLKGGPIATSTPHNTQEHIAESNNNNIKMVLEDESEIELTLSLGPTTHNPRRRRTESGHESLSSSSTGSSQTKKTSPTKSTNNNNNNSSSLSLTRGGDHHHQFTWGSSTNFPQGSDLEPGFSNGQPNNSPWLFQALSLKLT